MRGATKLAIDGCLRVVHVNINSLRYKRHIIQDIISSTKSHVIGILETWLDPLFDSRSLNIEDYVLVRCDRGLQHHVGKGKTKYMQGGGVAFYLHTSLSYTVLEAPTNKHLSETEYLLLEVSTRNKSNASRALLAVLYRRPAGLMLSGFFIMLEKYMQSYKNIIVVGDFNVDLSQNSYESSHL